jgi:hypothetical protein
MTTSRGLAKQGSEYGPDAAAQQNASGDHQENTKEDPFALGVILVSLVERQESAEQRNAAREHRREPKPSERSRSSKESVVKGEVAEPTQQGD